METNYIRVYGKDFKSIATSPVNVNTIIDSAYAVPNEKFVLSKHSRNIQFSKSGRRPVTEESIFSGPLVSMIESNISEEEERDDLVWDLHTTETEATGGFEHDFSTSENHSRLDSEILARVFSFDSSATIDDDISDVSIDRDPSYGKLDDVHSETGLETTKQTYNGLLFTTTYTTFAQEYNAHDWCENSLHPQQHACSNANEVGDEVAWNGTTVAQAWTCNKRNQIREGIVGQACDVVCFEEEDTDDNDPLWFSDEQVAGNFVLRGFTEEEDINIRSEMARKIA